MNTVETVIAVSAPYTVAPCNHVRNGQIVARIVSTFFKLFLTRSYDNLYIWITKRSRQNATVTFYRCIDYFDKFLAKVKLTKVRAFVNLHDKTLPKTR